MTIQRSALLVGATGLVGRRVLDRLNTDARYNCVTVLSRRPIGETGGKLELHVDDFERLTDLASEEPDLFAVDDVFCCLGTTLKAAGSKAAFEAVDYGHIVSLAKACANNGAKRFFLVSAIGANADSPSFYSRIKGRTEAAISAMGFESIYLVRPSLLLGERQEKRAGEGWAQRLAPALSPLLAGPLRRLRPVSADAVAQHLLDLAGQDAPGLHISYPSET